MSNAMPTRLASLACLAVVAWLGWRSINYVSARRSLTDSGTFACIGMAINKGKVPYCDIWEQKPPLVFRLNAKALKSGDGTFDAIRSQEREFAVLRAIIFFAIIMFAFRSPWVALASTLIMLHVFYAHPIFQQGNLTEEYATGYALCGILCVVLAASRSLVPFPFVVIAGFCFSTAALCKEPFVLSCLPWLAYVALYGKRDRKSVAHRVWPFCLGAAIPLLVNWAFYLYNGAFLARLDAISFSFGYVGDAPASVSLLKRATGGIDAVRQTIGSQSIVANVAFFVGFVSIFSAEFVKKHKYLPIVSIFAVLFDFLGTEVSPYHRGHYYMQFVPSFSLVVACGFAFLAHIARKASLHAAAVPCLTLLALCFLDRNAVADAVSRLSAPFERSEVGEIGRYIRANSVPTDTIWVPNGHDSRQYVECGLIPPTRFTHLTPRILKDTLLSTGDEKAKEIRDALVKNPPKFIVVSDCDWPNIERYEIEPWFRANYSKTRIPKLWERYGKHGKHGKDATNP